jgi:signal transduction histidine kinase/ABC-type sugar transport system substrate-binding protein
MEVVIGLFSFFDGMRDLPLVLGVNAATVERGAHVVTMAAIEVPYRREASAEAGRGKRWFHERISARSVEDVFAFDDASFDGVIFAFPEAGLAPYAAELGRRKTPTIVIGREVGTLPRVMNNNAAATRQAVTDLAARGHRRIVFLSGPRDNPCAERRLQGYLDGVRDCGLDADPALVLRGDFLPDTARRQMRHLLARNTSFTAVIAANDWSALAAMETLADAGRAIPDDVEVIGFDNVPACRWSTPTLSTFDGQLFEVGYVAVGALFQQMAGGGAPAETVVDPIFVPRGSTRETETTAPRILLDEWAANRFSAEHQLKRLRQSPAAAALIAQLEGPANKPDPAPVVRQLLREVARRHFNPICLFPLVQRCATTTAQAGSFGDADGLALLSNVVLLDTLRVADTEPRFSAATIVVREFSATDANEEAAVAAIQEVFQRLDIRCAGLFIRDPQQTSVDSGAWYWWRRSSSAPNGRAIHSSQRLDLRRLSNDSEAAAWFAVPLLLGEENMGLLVINGETLFLHAVPELARLIASTLRAVQLAAALRRVQSELIEASRLAGIAEISAGVLHNVGNILNSVNTSATVVRDRIAKLKLASVGKVAQLLTEQGDRLPEFFKSDPRAQQLAGFLATLHSHLEAEQNAALEEIQSMRTGIEQINQFVAAQREYEKADPVVESVAPAQLVQAALTICEAVVARHGVNVTRTVAEAPNVRVPRSKAVHVIVHLLRNAIEATEAREAGQREVALRAEAREPGAVRFTITDNGAGIAPENLTRVFQIGFTTKENGHGFGLHNSSLAAVEMGGALRVESAGLQRGASFILDLPADTSGKT